MSNKEETIHHYTGLNYYKGELSPPTMPGALPLIGNMHQFGNNPSSYLKKVRDQLGEIAEFKMFHQEMVLLTGNDASELFYRASDEELDQSEAYKLMTPIFGKGVIFDAPNDIKSQQLKMLMPALRDKPMRTYSEVIVQEVEGMIEKWGDSGEIDINVFMKELTIYTSSHCLLGHEFRYELNKEFAEVYHDLEKAVNPIAFIFPNLPLPVFKKRDKARIRLQELVTGIIEKRRAKKEKSTDAFQILIDSTYKDGSKLDANTLTGMLIATMFAGHHTSSGTSAWVLIELLKRPEIMRNIVGELDDLFGTDKPVTFESLRLIPKLENVIKEVLRLHPPLIMLIRKVTKDLHFKKYIIRAGKFVVAAPPVTHKIPELFFNPEVFDPDRYNPGREEDKKNFFAWQGFGGGKHKCTGNAFAMFQIKAIFAILLRRYEFELVSAPDTYADDYKQMVVQPKEPCRVRYRRRQPASQTTTAAVETPETKTDSMASSNQSSTVAPDVCPFPMTAKEEVAPVSSTTKTPSKTKKAQAEKKPTQPKRKSSTKDNKKTKAKSAKDIIAKSYHIAINSNLCQSHAVCMSEAPEIFEVSDGADEATLLKDTIDTTLFEKVKRAEKYCPNRAITVKELETTINTNK